MASSLASVLDQMLDCGMPPLTIVDLQVNTHKVVRYGPKKRGWYRIFESTSRSGRTFYSGAFGAYGLVESQRIEVDPGVFDAAERAELRERAAATRLQEELRRRSRADRARMSAAELWADGHKLDGARSNAYLARKGVDGAWPELRVDADGVLLVPMIRYDLERDQALVGMQRIWPDGTKRFGAGTAKQGAAVRIGPTNANPADPILLCEGIATGLSIALALGRKIPLFCAFDAGNLVPVAALVRELFPDAPIGICADDDWQTPGAPGWLYALRAARKCGRAQAVRPLFPEPRDAKATDFNDLQAVGGELTVRRQLAPFVEFLRGI